MLLLELLASTEALRSSGAAVLEQIFEAASELCAREEALEAEASRLKADRQQLQADRDGFGAECESVRQLNAQASDRIVLDVGGRHYSTSRQTLCAVPTSMLAAWFSGRHTIQARDDGTVFIDRSPVLFEYVLDFLRTGGSNPLLPSDENLRERLRDEFLYFGLTWPENTEPSIADLFTGDVDCVVIGSMFNPNDGIWLALGDNGRLFTSFEPAEEGDGHEMGILWDTKTGQRICAFSKHDAQYGEADSMHMDSQGQFVTSLRGRGDDSIVVFYNTEDGSREHAFTFNDTCLDDYIVLNGSKLVVSHRNENEVIVMSSRSISTGEVLWQREFPAVAESHMKFQYYYSDQAFVCTSAYNEYVVFDAQSGRQLYKAVIPMGTSTWLERDYWLDGKQINIAAIQVGDDGVFKVVYQSWDETGTLVVPPTNIDIAAYGLNYDSCLNFPNPTGSTFCTRVGGKEINMYPVTRAGLTTVEVKERMTMRLVDSDLASDVKIDVMDYAGASIAVLTTDGKLRVWALRGEKEKKRRRVGS